MDHQKKNSYERRAYESVDEKSLSLDVSRKTTKKNSGGLRLKNSINKKKEEQGHLVVYITLMKNRRLDK